ncbi:MAG TPA: hypothetical protein VFH04_00865 [Nitrososphaeraceae archaeon]|nr:hypothetical protein [Nitrososphaeraceae archaeon]
MKLIQFHPHAFPFKPMDRSIGISGIVKLGNTNTNIEENLIENKSRKPHHMLLRTDILMKQTNSTWHTNIIHLAQMRYLTAIEIKIE